MRKVLAGVVLGILCVMSVRLWASLASDARWMLGGLAVGLLVSVSLVLLVAAGMRRQARQPVISVYVPEDTSGEIVKRENYIVTSNSNQVSNYRGDLNRSGVVGNQYQ